MGFSLKSIVKGVENVARVSVAPVTGGLSLAKNKNQATAILEANAGAAALVGGAVVAPGAASALGGLATKAGGAVATAAIVRRALPAKMPAQPSGPSSLPVASLQPPADATINPTIDPTHTGVAGGMPGPGRPGNTSVNVSAPAAGDNTQVLMLGAALLAAKLLLA